MHAHENELPFLWEFQGTNLLFNSINLAEIKITYAKYKCNVN